MPKDLAAQLNKQEEKEAIPNTATTNAPQSNMPATRAKTKRRDREGLVNVAAWFPVRVKFELEEIRLERSRQLGRKVTMQEIQAEAYNDLFKKYGKPEMASIIEG